MATYTYITRDDPSAGVFGYGTYTYGYGINDLGQVVGAFAVPTGLGGGTGLYGFLYGAGNYTTIGAGYVEGTYLFGINNLGEEVGQYNDFSGLPHSFVSTAAGLVELNDPDSLSHAYNGTWYGQYSTFAKAINDAGQIVGSFYNDSGTYGFVHSGNDYSTGYTTINDPSATGSTVATGIDNIGEVVGYYSDALGTHGFIHRGGDYSAGYTTIDYGSNTTLIAINNVGQILGQSDTGYFLDTNGVFTAVNGLPGQPTGLNDVGQIVGSYGAGYGGTHAFVATPAGQVYLPPDQDIWTTSVYSYAPGGGGPGGGLADDVLKVGGWGDFYYSLLKLDLSGLPTSASHVELRLYDLNSGSGTPAGLNLYEITQDWNWLTQGTGTDHNRLWWADQPAAVIDSADPNVLTAPTVGAYYYIDITNLYNAWQSGLIPNDGLELRPTGNWNVFDIFASSRNSNPDYQPALVIASADMDHPPTVDLAHSIVTGTINELPNVTGSSTVDSAAGAIAFADPDLNDRPTASVTHASVTWQDSQRHVHALTDIQIFNFENALLVVPESGNTNSGKIDWGFTIADSALDFLAVGETVTVTKTVEIDDGHGGKVDQDVTATINGANDLPVAQADSAAVQKGGTLTGNVLANDYDPDTHDTLHVARVNGFDFNVTQKISGLYGTLTLNSDGGFVYNASQKTGTDTFSYSIDDSHGGQITSNLSIAVTSGPPAAVLHGIDFRATSATASGSLDLSSVSTYDGFGTYSYIGGTQFVATYLGTASNSGYLRATPDDNAFAQHNLSVVSIFERSPTSVGYFTKAQADSDAVDAIAAAHLAGQPASSAIYFTVDYDTPKSDLPVIESYFEQIKSDLKGSGFYLGVYGPGHVLAALQGDTKVMPDYAWLTLYAWGREGFKGENIDQVFDSPRATPLTVGSSTQPVDLDTALTPQYGQWDHHLLV